MPYVPEGVESVLYKEEEIQKRVRELAQKIKQDYADVEFSSKNQLVLVGILKGSFHFIADLARALWSEGIPTEIEFMCVSSYGDSTSSGAVRILMDVRKNIENKHVVIVEDIVDSGNTLEFLRNTLHARLPASLRVCSFLVAPKSRRKVDLEPFYCGFHLPENSGWVIGYGMDVAEQYRNMPFIGIYKRE
eukprot:gb/GECH01010685.1/.p1 GENE.gb/GECH01010685.1/~~gb/GECH01010685.1/.p1  ORF type:complete len:190 (+),score=35.44 gb/GECH01010685.1/:1-570(+)